MLAILRHLRELRCILDEHPKQLGALRRIAQQLVVERAIAERFSDRVEENASSRSERGIKLDTVLAGIEKLPPDELRRQIELADALREEQSCQTPP